MTGSKEEINKKALVVPPLTDAQVADAARELRERYYRACGKDAGKRLMPQELVWDLLDPEERLSLDVESKLGETEEGQRIAGQMVVYDHGGMIRIDAELSRLPLYHFTLGHEIGHWVLHRKTVTKWLQMLRENGDTSTEFLTLNRDVGHHSRKCPDVEWQANRFSVHLLMPSDLVTKEFRLRYGRVERRYSELASSPSFTRQHASPLDYARFMAHQGQSASERSLAKAFATSIESMAIRLQELQLV